MDDHVSTYPGSPVRLLGLYMLLLVGAVVLFLGICELGERLTAPATTAAVARPGAGHAKPVDVVVHVLATLAAVIGLGNLLAWCFRRIGQPAVIGEVIAGIVLGPSVLGAISPELMHILIPGPLDDPQRIVVAALGAIAQLGVILYLFVVGLDLNLEKVGKHAHAAVAISHASIVLPFVLGTGLALWLYPLLSSRDVSFASFSLFLGAAMSITAFPVLARILSDQRIEKSELGVIALSCAATDDVTAWCLLALVVGVTRARVGDAVVVAAATVAFVACMLLIVRPMLRAWIDRRRSSKAPEAGELALLVIGVLLAALTTEAIGIHAAFGAFLFGAVIPHDSSIARTIGEQLRTVVTVLFLPAFFAITGMNTQIGLISGVENWLMCATIILVATLGKFGGTMAACRLVGIRGRMAAALGILMNTRGLMELIVLNIGLTLGVISPRLYAMMVLMALATTIATTPILNLLIPRRTAADA